MRGWNPDDGARTREGCRGLALLAFAGPPTPQTLEIMVACAENLGRGLVTAIVANHSGGVITNGHDVARVAALVRRGGAAIVVVAAATPAACVRQLASSGRRPVLVARTTVPWQLVLSATDLRSPGLPVLSAGVTLAATRGARSLVLHNVAPVWATPSILTAPGAGGPSSVARRLRRLVRVAARTTPPSQVVVASSHAADRAILRAAEQREVDVLVVGMHRPAPGANRARRRCADHVVAAAKGNVLAVPLGARRRMLRLEARR